MGEYEKLIYGLRVHINSLGVACCTCGAKTFQAEWHDANCRVRNLAEASDNLDDVAATISRLTEEVERLRLERDANHNLAVANGERARDEHARAEAAEARVKELEGVVRGADQTMNALEELVQDWRTYRDIVDAIACKLSGEIR